MNCSTAPAARPKRDAALLRMDVQPACQTTFDVRQDLRACSQSSDSRTEDHPRRDRWNVRVRRPSSRRTRGASRSWLGAGRRRSPSSRAPEFCLPAAWSCLPPGHRAGSTVTDWTSDRTHDEPWQRCQRSLRISIDHPSITPASLPGVECVDRGLPRAIPIRIGVELRLHVRFQVHLDHRLRQFCRRQWECPSVAHFRPSSVFRPTGRGGGKYVPDDIRFQIL